MWVRLVLLSSSAFPEWSPLATCPLCPCPLSHLCPSLYLGFQTHLPLCAEWLLLSSEILAPASSQAVPSHLLLLWTKHHLSRIHLTPRFKRNWDNICSFDNYLMADTYIVTWRACLVAQSCPTLCHPMDYIAQQAPLSMGIFRQKYWSGLPFPHLGDLPDPGIKFMCLLHGWWILYLLSHQGSTISWSHFHLTEQIRQC